MSRPLDALIARYNPKSADEFENALKEVIQEIALAGLAQAHFFSRAAFYGGTALRIFHKLPRFSEDLDFTLLSNQPDFSLKSYFKALQDTLTSFGLEVEIEDAQKKLSTDVESAFVKANTKIHLLKIEAGREYADKIQSNKKLVIKFEVDTTPSVGFETEVKILPPPITSAVKVLKPSSLFAGKMHAILFRKWKLRVKGRDFYDLLWYLGNRVPLRLIYLEAKMREGGAWSGDRKLGRSEVLNLLEARIKSIDFESASKDVYAFIEDPEELSAWSQDFFLAAIQMLQVE